MIAASADDVLLAGAFAGDFVASSVVEGAESVAPASFASFRVVHVTVPIASFTSGEWNSRKSVRWSAVPVAPM